MKSERSTGSSMSLNTDIGEGYGSWVIADDEALLEIVTDANIACGFHASDPDIMRRTCATAAANNVSIGAQVSFFDIRGFGRRFIEVPQDSLVNDILYQLGALSAFASLAGSPIAFVKTHGALDHAAIKFPAYADAVVRAVLEFDSSLPIMCQPGTGFSDRVTTADIRMIREGYIDRSYTADGLLVPRGRAGAVITDPELAARRAVQLATEHTVETIDGEVIDMDVDSMCIHSDSPGAAAVATVVRTALEDAGVQLEPLASTAT